MSYPVNRDVQFSSLKIGDTFFCWGDIIINYDYPKYCECIKTGEETAEDKNGISFLVSKLDTVTIKF